jgi:hypothetical protein
MPESAISIGRRGHAYLLISEQGQAYVASRDFLSSPILVGGDARALPAELRPYVTGCYDLAGQRAEGC